MAALPLPRAAAPLLLLVLLAAPLLCAAQAPISQPPSPGSPTASPLLRPADEEDKPVSPSAAHSPAQSPAGADDGEKTAPLVTAPAVAPAPASSSSAHSTATPAPAPTPASASDDDDDASKKKPEAPAPAPASASDEDAAKKKTEKSPAPAPAAMEVKSGTGAGVAADAEAERRDEGMSGGKKAGAVVGAFSAAAVVGLAAVVYRKRQANIRRSRYADYSARTELV